MALDERLRESLKALDAMEERPADIVDAVIARGRRYRLLRRLAVGAVAVVAAVTSIAVAPRTLDMWRGDERVPAVPAPGGAVGQITTIAGTGAGYSTGDGGPAAEASLIASGVIGFDAVGNLYVQDDDVRVRRIDPSGVITTVVGLSAGGEPAPGEAGSVQGRAGAVDLLGNLYVGADGRVAKVTPSGTVSTVAGTGREGFSGDGGPATEARVSLAYAGMAVDSDGNLYIAQYRYDRVRVMVAPRAKRGSMARRPSVSTAKGTCTSRTYTTIGSAGSIREGSSRRWRGTARWVSPRMGRSRRRFQWAPPTSQPTSKATSTSPTKPSPGSSRSIPTGSCPSSPAPVSRATRVMEDLPRRRN
jgi:hypothetical protein